MTERSPAYHAAVALIDAANEGDPLALDHGRRAAAWVERLDPDATEAQLLAARAHHLRRASFPRSAFPPGRAGYLRWRKEAKERHAAEAAALLEQAGCDPEVIARVQALIRKEGVGRDGATDPAAQVHEDAACLTFLETQLDDVAAELGDDRAVEVLVKTARKMSPAALEAAARLPLSERGRTLLQRAAESLG